MTGHYCNGHQVKHIAFYYKETVCGIIVELLYVHDVFNIGYPFSVLLGKCLIWSHCLLYLIVSKHTLPI